MIARNRKRPEQRAFGLPALIPSSIQWAAFGPDANIKSEKFLKGAYANQDDVLVLLLCSGLAAENLEKTQKKELETQVKAMTAEAQSLERAGQLAEARIKYAESQALIEVKDVTDAIKHLDEEIQKRVKRCVERLAQTLRVAQIQRGRRLRWTKP